MMPDIMFAKQWIMVKHWLKLCGIYPFTASKRIYAKNLMLD